LSCPSLDIQGTLINITGESIALDHDSQFLIFLISKKKIKHTHTQYCAKVLGRCEKCCKVRMLSEIDMLIDYIYQLTKWKVSEQNKNLNQIHIWCDHPLPSSIA
jgi:hypothetical protein